MDKLKRCGMFWFIKNGKQWQPRYYSSIDKSFDKSFDKSIDQLSGICKVKVLKWMNKGKGNMFLVSVENRWMSFKKQESNENERVTETSKEIGKDKEKRVVTNVSNVSNNEFTDLDERNEEEEEEEEEDNEDNEDNEDINEKYIKSFYEIYNDDKDTYDCPADILRFIRKEHIDVKIKIKCSSPRNLKKKDIQDIVVDMFKNSEEIREHKESKGKKEEERETPVDKGNSQEVNKENVYYLKSRFKEFGYPDRNVMWPNPLVYNHRLQPFFLKKEEHENSENFERNKKTLEANKNRLENLWSYSNSYGVCWDWLDDLYLDFQKKKTEHLNEWENNKNQIMLYASKVCKRKLIKSRKELLDKLNIDYSNNIYNNYDENENINAINLEEEDQTEYNLLLPRSIFRKWTRTLYFYWKDRYMHYYNNTLCDYLKGEIVDRQLLREHNERNLNLTNKKMLETHSYDLKKVKGSNLYITRFVKQKKRKGKEKEKEKEKEEKKSTEGEFDFTGIGECVYYTKQKQD